VINTNLSPILHRFRDYSLRWVQNRYIWLPLLRLTLPTEGVPWDDLREIFRGCLKWHRNIVENFNRLSRVHASVTDRRRRTGDSIASSRSLIKTKGQIPWELERDGRPAEYRWRPLFNAAKFG